jgi:hypothetical protein
MQREQDLEDEQTDDEPPLGPAEHVAPTWRGPDDVHAHDGTG